MDPTSVQLAAAVTLNLAVAALVGASMSSAWLRMRRSSWAAAQMHRLWLAALAAAGVAIVSSIALLWLEAASMAEVALQEAAPAVRSALTATHYGYAWTIGICSLVVAALASAVHPSRRHASAAALVRLLAIGAFLYSRSIVSHAGAGGDLSWPVAVEWLHLVLISVWVGEVTVAGLAVLRASAAEAQDERLDRAAYIRALSRSATVALGGILATGLVSAWHGLGSIANATGNAYASILLVKLAFVGAAALLGAANRFCVMPALLRHLSTGAGTGRPARMFAIVLQLEALVLAGALVMAAILGSTSPPTAG